MAIPRPRGTFVVTCLGVIVWVWMAFPALPVRPGSPLFSPGGYRGTHTVATAVFTTLVLTLIPLLLAWEALKDLYLGGALRTGPLRRQAVQLSAEEETWAQSVSLGPNEALDVRVTMAAGGRGKMGVEMTLVDRGSAAEAGNIGGTWTPGTRGRRTLCYGAILEPPDQHGDLELVVRVRQAVPRNPQVCIEYSPTLSLKRVLHRHGG